jgi:hypothetical protein
MRFVLKGIDRGGEWITGGNDRWVRQTRSINKKGDHKSRPNTPSAISHSLSAIRHPLLKLHHYIDLRRLGAIQQREIETHEVTQLNQRQHLRQRRFDKDLGGFLRLSATAR